MINNKSKPFNFWIVWLFSVFLSFILMSALAFLFWQCGLQFDYLSGTISMIVSTFLGTLFTYRSREVRDEY